jgi:Xaa-Pro aminopeptidase
VVSEPAEIAGGERPMLGFETLTLAPIDRRLVETSLLTAEEIAQFDAYHARVAATVAPLVPADVADWLRRVCAPL